MAFLKRPEWYNEPMSESERIKFQKDIAELLKLIGERLCQQ